MKMYDKNKKARLSSAFFREIDAERIKSSCSLRMVYTLLAVIFLVFLTGLILVGRWMPVWSGDLSFKVHDVPQPAVIAGEVKISEEELNRLLGTSQPDFPLKSAYAGIEPEGITITGRTSDHWLSMRVSAQVLPVMEPSPHLRVTKLTTFGVPVPEQVSKRVGAALDPAFDNLLGSLGTIENIVLQKGFLTVYVAQ